MLAATGSVLTNKYAEGYPGRRYYGGNQVVDEVEDLARQRAKALFGAEHANVQPHAGANANLAVYQALLEPGDTILAMRLDHGGHLTHGSPASITSKIWRFVAYGVTPASTTRRPGEVIDFDQVADLAKREQPRLIVAGSTAYSRIIDPAPFREIADEVGALFMFDAAHPAGLIAGGVHPSPVGVADVVTLHHPQDPARSARRRHPVRGRPGQEGRQRGLPRAAGWAAGARDRRQGGGLRRGCPTRVRRLRRPGGRATPRPWPRPWPTEGFRLVSGGTDNHMVLVDLRPFDAELTGKEAQEVLDRAGITCNRNTIPDDPRSPFVTSGLRLGTAAETTAGMGPVEMGRIADLIARTLGRRAEDAAVAQVRAEVGELCAAFPPYPTLDRRLTGAARRLVRGGTGGGSRDHRSLLRPGSLALAAGGLCGPA